MSHLSKIEVEINCIDTLKAACDRLGLEFRFDQPDFLTYGGTRSQCRHAIRSSQASFEVGVVENPDGKSWNLLWDNWRTGGLEPLLGKNAGKLKQAYGVERAKREAIRKGYRVREQVNEKNIRLVVTL